MYTYTILFSGNFAREFCDEMNADFISNPLPECPEKETWRRLMTLWRCMRMVHKSNQEPTSQHIDMFKQFAVEFQEKLSSLAWVNPANQVHRLSHLAYFMQAREVKSIGTYSLEGLEHGNWTTKINEGTRIWKGDNKVGQKQLFRLLRWKGSPTLKRASKLLEGAKRKPDTCSRCNTKGHKKNSKQCPLYNQAAVEPNDEQGEPLVQSDEESGEDILTDQGEESQYEDEEEEEIDSDDEELTNREYGSDISDELDDSCETQ